MSDAFKQLQQAVVDGSFIDCRKQQAMKITTIELARDKIKKAYKKNDKQTMKRN